MPICQVNGDAPASLFYQVRRPIDLRNGQERGYCFLCTGYQTEGYTWEPQVRDLLARGYVCLTFDNRGCGRSDKPKYRYTTAMLARDAMELLCRELRWRPREVHLIAISLGGMYGLEMLAGLREGAFLDLVGPEETTFMSATLMVTQAVGWRSPAHGFVPVEFFQVLAKARLMPGTAKAKLYREMEQIFSREWLQADSGLRHPKSGARLTNGESFVRRGAKEYYAKAAEGLNPDNGIVAAMAQVLAVATHCIEPAKLEALADHLASAACPVLVVCAGNDRLVRYSNQLRLAKALGPAVVELLDLNDSAHGVVDERRDEVNAAIMRVLDEGERRREEVQRSQSPGVAAPSNPDGVRRARIRSRL